MSSIFSLYLAPSFSLFMGLPQTSALIFYCDDTSGLGKAKCLVIVARPWTPCMESLFELYKKGNVTEQHKL